MDPTSKTTPEKSQPDTNLATLTPNLVSNIPIHNPGGAQPVNEDEELDKIMQDVGKDLKDDLKNQTQKHFLFFGKSPKKPKVQSKTKIRVQATPQPKPQSLTTPKPVAAVKAVAKPPKNNLPVVVIVMTLMVTGALITAAIYAYK